MIFRGRKIRLMQDESDLLLMPDARLDYLGDEFMTQAREITFEQFAKDRNLALNIEHYARWRESKNQPPLVEALPV